MNNLFYRKLETLRGRKKREEKDKQLVWGERPYPWQASLACDYNFACAGCNACNVGETTQSVIRGLSHFQTPTAF